MDARGGLAYEASAIAVKQAIERARRYGVAFCGVTNSHHFGAAGFHLAPIAEAGLAGLAFTNSPAAINAWGGKSAFFGTQIDDILSMTPRPRFVWFQLGIKNDEAAKKLEDAGITVIQNRCTLADHQRLGLGRPERR